MVRWFVDGAMVYSQTGDDVTPLVHPMRVMMNLWIAPYPDWVGDFDPAVLPVQGRRQSKNALPLVPFCFVAIMFP